MITHVNILIILTNLNGTKGKKMAKIRVYLSEPLLKRQDSGIHTSLTSWYARSALIWFPFKLKQNPFAQILITVYLDKVLTGRYFRQWKVTIP